MGYFMPTLSELKKYVKLLQDANRGSYFVPILKAAQDELDRDISVFLVKSDQAKPDLVRLFRQVDMDNMARVDDSVVRASVTELTPEMESAIDKAIIYPEKVGDLVGCYSAFNALLTLVIKKLLVVSVTFNRNAYKTSSLANKREFQKLDTGKYRVNYSDFVRSGDDERGLELVLNYVLNRLSEKAATQRERVAPEPPVDSSSLTTRRAAIDSYSADFFGASSISASQQPCLVSSLISMLEGQEVLSSQEAVPPPLFMRELIQIAQMQYSGVSTQKIIMAILFNEEVAYEATTRKFDRCSLLFDIPECSACEDGLSTHFLLDECLPMLRRCAGRMTIPQSRAPTAVTNYSFDLIKSKTADGRAVLSIKTTSGGKVLDCEQRKQLYTEFAHGLLNTLLSKEVTPWLIKHTIPECSPFFDSVPCEVPMYKAPNA
jgi:hypothetical protein